MTRDQAATLLWTVVGLIEAAYGQPDEPEEVDSPGRWKCPKCKVWTLDKSEHQC